MGGKHFSKTFSIFCMLNSKNRFFNWYLSNKKTAFVDKSRVEPTIFFIEKISFSLKLYSGHFHLDCHQLYDLSTSCLDSGSSRSDAAYNIIT